MSKTLMQLLASNRQKGEFRAEGNVIYVYDVIVASEAEAAWWGGVAADSFVKALKAMSGDVTLRINSPGGDVFAARAMSQAIKDHQGKVTAHVDGYAASAATFLTSAADETLMADGSMMMIHDSSTIVWGNAEDCRRVADLLTKIDGTIAETYAAAAKRRGAAEQDFEALMDAETWFTADEAIEAGLADAKAAESVKDKIDWDLSAYAHAPIVSAEETEEDKEPAPSADEPAPESPAPEPDKIEDRRPNFAADMILRPAA